MNASNQLKLLLRLKYQLKKASIESMMEEILSLLNVTEVKTGKVQWMPGYFSIEATTKEMSFYLTCPFLNEKEAAGTATLRVGPPKSIVMEQEKLNKRVPYYIFDIEGCYLDLAKLISFSKNYQVPTEFEDYPIIGNPCAEVFLID